MAVDHEASLRMDDALRREMGGVLAALYVIGGTIVLVAVALPFWTDADVTAIAAIAVTAVAIGAAVAWMSQRRALPWLIFPIAVGVGAVIVSVAVYFGGPGGSGVLAVFYAFVTGFAFYYFSTGVAVVELLIAAIGYGVALTLLDVPTMATQMTLVIGAVATAGGTMGVIGHRAAVDRLEATQAKAELEEIDQFKTALMRAAAHDVRTPLAIISGIASTVRRQIHALDDAAVVDLMDRLLNNAERLNALITNLYDLDRLSSGRIELETESVVLLDFVRRVVEDSAIADHPVDVSGDPVTVHVDPALLGRAVENLVRNAETHTTPGTPIHVRVERLEDGALLVVEDEGTGVPDHLRDTIWEPFERGDAATPGTGLGLFLVKRFVEVHGGSVGVDDRSGGGARFSIRLPGGSRAAGDASEPSVPVGG